MYVTFGELIAFTSMLISFAMFIVTVISIINRKR